MPYRIRKVDGYRVSSPHGVKAKHTTYQKARKQVALLKGIEHGWKPTGKKSKRRYSKKTHRAIGNTSGYAGLGKVQWT